MIKVKGLTKEFIRKGRDGKMTAKKAVDDLSFEIAQGEIFGLLGPNGAGKTTTIRMLTMQTRKTSGDIQYNGISIEKNEKAIKAMIGVVPQHINFDMDLTVGQKRIQELLRYIELEDTVNMSPRQLSGGMKRRLLIARALIHKPQILFMDEPTVALDPQVRHRIWDLIREMAAQGVTVLLTTHYIEEAEKLCNRVAIINKGKLVDIDTPASFCQQMGRYTVEWQTEEGRQFKFFDSKEEAAGFAATLDSSHIRRSNLEDVFIELTGRREGI